MSAAAAEFGPDLADPRAHRVVTSQILREGGRRCCPLTRPCRNPRSIRDAVRPLTGTDVADDVTATRPDQSTSRPVSPRTSSWTARDSFCAASTACDPACGSPDSRCRDGSRRPAGDPSDSNTVPTTRFSCATPTWASAPRSHDGRADHPHEVRRLAPAAILLERDDPARRHDLVHRVHDTLRLRAHRGSMMENRPSAVCCDAPPTAPSR